VSGGLTYGPEWLAFREWYLSRWWTRHRCFWCRTRGTGGWHGNPIQLNHLTYAGGDVPRWWQVKPLCKRCHTVETAVTRWLRPRLPYRWRSRAHYLVTYGARWLSRGALLLVAWPAAQWVLSLW
jgi:hypothetical protein